MSSCSHRAPPSPSGDRGQAAVEFAIAVPVVLMMVVGVVQLAAIVGNMLAIELAAREGARAAAVSGTPAAAAERAAGAAIGLEPLDVTTNVAGGAVTVEVAYRHRPGSLLGVVVPDIDLAADVTMALEPP